MADPLDQITRLAGNLSPQLESFLATELEKLTYDVLAFQSMINKEVAIKILRPDIEVRPAKCWP